MLIGMIACRAFYRGLNAFEDVAAYLALPFDGFLTFPYSAIKNALAHLQEALAVMILDSGNGSEAGCNFGIAFLLCHRGSIGVEFDTFHFLFMGSDSKIVDSRRQHAGVDTDRPGGDSALSEIFQENLAMVELIVGCLLEDIGVLIITLFLGTLRKIDVTRVRTRLSHICGGEVNLRTRAFYTFICHNF